MMEISGFVKNLFPFRYYRFGIGFIKHAVFHTGTGCCNIAFAECGQSEVTVIVSNGKELIALIFSETSGKIAFSELCESSGVVTILIYY